jgi:hypothetical protein
MPSTGLMTNFSQFVPEIHVWFECFHSIKLHRYYRSSHLTFFQLLQIWHSAMASVSTLMISSFVRIWLFTTEQNVLEKIFWLFLVVSHGKIWIHHASSREMIAFWPMFLETGKLLDNSCNCTPCGNTQIGLPLIYTHKSVVCYNAAAIKGFRDQCGNKRFDSPKDLVEWL